jgi:hypothetical protein
LPLTKTTDSLLFKAAFRDLFAAEQVGVADRRFKYERGLYRAPADAPARAAATRDEILKLVAAGAAPTLRDFVPRPAAAPARVAVAAAPAPAARPRLTAPAGNPVGAAVSTSAANVTAAPKPSYTPVDLNLLYSLPGLQRASAPVTATGSPAAKREVVPVPAVEAELAPVYFFGLNNDVCVCIVFVPLS